MAWVFMLMLMEQLVMFSFRLMDKYKNFNNIFVTDNFMNRVVK